MDSSDDDFDAMPVRIRSNNTPAATPQSAKTAPRTPLSSEKEGQQQKSPEEEHPRHKGVTFNFAAEEHSVSADTSRYDSESQTKSYGDDLAQLENSALAADEEFQPAENAEFFGDLDFLEGRGGDDRFASERQAALARQSLYTKFDPLVGNPAEAARSRLSELNRREDPFVHCPEPSEDLASLMISDERYSNEEQARDTPSMTATPSNSVFSPQQKQRNSIDRASRSSGSRTENTSTGDASQLVEPLLYTQSDLDAVMKARDQDREKKITELQAKLKNERADHTAKQDSLKKEINEMKTIVGEYEKTIIELTENSQRNTMIKDGTLSDLIKEKEQLRSDLNTAESGIIEAYKRVETLKRAVEDYRSNETQLKQCIEDFKEKLRRSEERYQTLKKHAEEKLDFANREIGKVRKAKEVDMAGLEATVKKCQAKASTLEQSLNQKISENEELTKICDDLINRVSGKAD